ncbi:serine/threonine protein kinase, partial [Vibrio parahaemolyticus]|nr:serine/threonine protein kinase [Vibrio parahaemolyticus]
MRLVQRSPLVAALSVIIVLSGVVFGYSLIQKNIHLQQEKKIAEYMMNEMTRLILQSKGHKVEHLSENTMMELKRRRILSNPE